MLRAADNLFAVRPHFSGECQMHVWRKLLRRGTLVTLDARSPLCGSETGVHHSPTARLSLT